MYVTHFIPSSGRALDLLNELFSVSMMFGGTVKVLGCDGTAVNTGVKGGACRLFELVTNMTVHWFVCQLHSNELNLQHLLCTLDGTTSGPRSFSGPIGSSSAADVWTLEVVSFQPVTGQVEEPPEDLIRSLSLGPWSGDPAPAVPGRAERLHPSNDSLPESRTSQPRKVTYSLIGKLCTYFFIYVCFHVCAVFMDLLPRAVFIYSDRILCSVFFITRTRGICAVANCQKVSCDINF